MVLLVFDVCFDVFCCVCVGEYVVVVMVKCFDDGFFEVLCVIGDDGGGIV